MYPALYFPMRSRRILKYDEEDEEKAYYSEGELRIFQFDEELI